MDDQRNLYRTAQFAHQNRARYLLNIWLVANSNIASVEIVRRYVARSQQVTELSVDEEHHGEAYAIPDLEGVL